MYSSYFDDKFVVFVHSPISSVTSRHMFTPTSEAAFGKRGILCLRFRKTGRHIAALTLGANVPPFISTKGFCFFFGLHRCCCSVLSCTYSLPITHLFPSCCPFYELYVCFFAVDWVQCKLRLMLCHVYTYWPTKVLLIKLDSLFFIRSRGACGGSAEGSRLIVLMFSSLVILFWLFARQQH